MPAFSTLVSSSVNCISECTTCMDISKSSSNTYVFSGDLLTSAGRPGKPQQEAARSQAGILGLMDDVCNLDTISLQSYASYQSLSFLWSLPGLPSARPILGVATQTGDSIPKQHSLTASSAAP